MNLFTDKACSYCGSERVKKNNSFLWDGFLDADTGQLVCNQCKTHHYQEKNKGDLRHLYSEMPVMARG